MRLSSSTPSTPKHALALLADRVGRLSPHHRDPERFHIDKSEIVAELRRLARQSSSAMHRSAGK